MEIGLYRPSNHRRRGGQTYEKSEQTNEQTNRQPNDIHSMYQVRIGGQYATRSEEVSAHIYSKYVRITYKVAVVYTDRYMYYRVRQQHSSTTAAAVRAILLLCTVDSMIISSAHKRLYNLLHILLFSHQNTNTAVYRRRVVAGYFTRHQQQRWVLHTVECSSPKPRNTHRRSPGRSVLFFALFTALFFRSFIAGSSRRFYPQ